MYINKIYIKILNTQEVQIMENSKLVLFTSNEGNITIDVRIAQDTVWLSLNQLSALFGRDKSVISRHIKNIFNDQELISEATVAFFATVQPEGERTVERNVEYYNLDAILSVGYRVNSKQETQFRIWATKRLKDYLMQGYAINHNIIDTTHQEYQNIIDLLGRTLINNRLDHDQQANIINLISQYAKTWTTLLQYDEDSLLLPSNKDEQSIQYSTTGDW